MSTVRPRRPEDMPGALAALRVVQQVDHYPTRWPADPVGWLTPDGLLESWVAEHDGAIVGGAGLVAGTTHTVLSDAVGVPVAALTVVTRLFVAPDGRGLGLAKQLVTATVEYARARDSRVALDVIATSRPAVALYESLGWTLAGTGIAEWRTQAGDHPPVRYYLSPAADVR